MLVKTAIAKAPFADRALDQQRLYAAGLETVRDLAREIWTDHNVHDPGITILELACFALTDLAYRASVPIEDLLATESDNAANMRGQFFTARQALPNRALTALDFRKLVIDLKDVQNAWIHPVDLEFAADTIHKHIVREQPPGPGVRPVQIRGLFRVQVEYMADVAEGDRAAINDAVLARLQANRNLCELFTGVTGVDRQPFVMCGEIELAPTADTAVVAATILRRIQHYLAPPVRNYTLTEMLGRTRADGSPYTVADAFSGPALDCGFIDDEELAAAELRTEVHLSDVIALVMGVDGVSAVRDLIVQPVDQTTPLASRWVVPVAAEHQPTLDVASTLPRLVFRKRNIPVAAPLPAVQSLLDQFERDARRMLETPAFEDVPVPLGRYRRLDDYYSFQNHFPAIFGLSDAGIPAGDPSRQALAYQLKAYLLFFDQIMANACAQLAHAGDLLACSNSRVMSNERSGDDWAPAVGSSSFVQLVKTFAGYQSVYTDGSGKSPMADSSLDALRQTLQKQLEGDRREERWNRILDHLIARVGERFHEYAGVMASAFGTSASELARTKTVFLAECDRLSSERALAVNLAATTGAWDTAEVSGLERRIARLLGIEKSTRRDLVASEADPSQDQEGLYLIENLRLLPGGNVERPICADPNCVDCADDDPFSYRLHVILPAEAGRFRNMDFRRFAEEVIRHETPAHILPKICWISRAQMIEMQSAYRAWLEFPSSASADERSQALEHFVGVLAALKNVYPKQAMRACDSPEDQGRFILGQTALGTENNQE